MSKTKRLQMQRAQPVTRNEGEAERLRQDNLALRRRVAELEAQQTFLTGGAGATINALTTLRMERDRLAAELDALKTLTTVWGGAIERTLASSWSELIYSMTGRRVEVTPADFEAVKALFSSFLELENNYRQCLAHVGMVIGHIRAAAILAKGDTLRVLLGMEAKGEAKTKTAGLEGTRDYAVAFQEVFELIEDLGALFDGPLFEAAREARAALKKLRADLTPALTALAEGKDDGTAVVKALAAFDADEAGRWVALRTAMARKKDADQAAARRWAIDHIEALRRTGMTINDAINQFLSEAAPEGEDQTYVYRALRQENAINLYLKWVARM